MTRCRNDSRRRGSAPDYAFFVVRFSFRLGEQKTKMIS